MVREYYSIPEVAALLGVSRIAVFKRVKKGQLAALRFGRNWAVPAAALEAALPAVSPLPAAFPLPAPRPEVVPSNPSPQKKEAELPPPSSDDEMSSMGWD